MRLKQKSVRRCHNKVNHSGWYQKWANRYDDAEYYDNALYRSATHSRNFGYAAHGDFQRQNSEVPSQDDGRQSLSERLVDKVFKKGCAKKAVICNRVEYASCKKQGVYVNLLSNEEVTYDVPNS